MLVRVLIKCLVDSQLLGVYQAFNKAEWKQLKHAASFLHIEECDNLWVSDEVTQVKRYIPPITDCEAIVMDALRAMGFLKG